MKRRRIAVLAGDGVGPEVTAEAMRALRAATDRMDDLSFECIEYPVGAGEFRRSGNELPGATLEAARAADAVFLGAIGLPDVRHPDGREITPQIDLRERLDLYCGLRPVRLYHPSHSPLANPGPIDFLLVRESTEGLFSARRDPAGEKAEEVRDEMRITRRGSERVFRAAFREARTRGRKLTLVDKANVLPSMVFFRKIFDEIAREFPDVETERVYVDAASLYLVRRPASFGVLVTENQFGDILSDLASGLVGGMGMAPSADLGDRHGVFQPAHGSAPDIAGKGIANPVAAILSVGMMLEWLGHPRPARRIQEAVERVLSDPRNRTPDIGGTMKTGELGGRIVEEIAR